MSADRDGPGAAPANSAVLQAFEPYLDAIADKLAERLERRRDRMISQHDSELGPRRHREACKRRLDKGEGGAGHVGRNYLLTREAIREELAAGRGGKGGRGKPGAGPSPVPAGGDGSPSSGSPTGSSGAKSRARDLGDFERNLMTGLRALNERP